MTRFLCLWLPNWPIQRLLRSRPELKARPVALVASGRVACSRARAPRRSRGRRSVSMSAHRMPTSGHEGMPRGLVAACSSEAVAQGVRPSMPLAEAQSLVHELAIAPHEPLADRQTLEKLAEACERFSPCVALEEGDEPESLLLDISNLEHLYGSEHKLASQMQNVFTRRGYSVRTAVADTVGMAWAASHFGKEDCKMHDHPTDGARKCKFSIADPGAPNNLQFAICNLQFAFPFLPVEALRIHDDTAKLLRELGIETVGQLLSLPREGLTSRFGDQLLRRLDQLTGAEPELIEPHRALAALEATRALDEPTADRAVLMHVLSQLVEQLTRQLAARDLGAVRLICVLHSPGGTVSGGTPGVCDGRGGNAQTTPFADPAPGKTGCQVPAQGVPPKRCGGRAVPLRIGLLHPSANARQLLELIELHLETVTLSDEVDRLEIRAAVVGRLGQRQRELFAERWPTDPHQLALLVNRLSSRLGYERVLRAELRASPVPERAVCWAPVTKGRDKETRRQGDKERSGRSHSPCLPLSLSPPLPPRPLLLHPQLQALEVVCVAPDGPPQFVWLDRRRERIVHHVGPERIETLWWRGPSVRRDYYRVATESGSHLWIFRRLSDARWFLHGIFA